MKRRRGSLRKAIESLEEKIGTVKASRYEDIETRHLYASEFLMATSGTKPWFPWEAADSVESLNAEIAVWDELRHKSGCDLVDCAILKILWRPQYRPCPENVASQIMMAVGSNMKEMHGEQYAASHRPNFDVVLRQVTPRWNVFYSLHKQYQAEEEAG